MKVALHVIKFDGSTIPPLSGCQIMAQMRYLVELIEVHFI
jgi:hypothetical protein